MRQAHSNHVPQIREYLGMHEWAVRWDIQEDASREEKDITAYIYNEEIFNKEPDYGMFVTTYLRNYYSLDQENALKSNMIETVVDPTNPRSIKTIKEWEDFEKCRNDAKIIGRQVFNISE